MRSWTIALPFVFILASPYLRAQGGAVTARLAGTVLDPDEAPVPSARITFDDFRKFLEFFEGADSRVVLGFAGWRSIALNRTQPSEEVYPERRSGLISRMASSMTRFPSDRRTNA